MKEISITKKESVLQVRHGRGPFQVQDDKGKVICACEIPAIYFDLDGSQHKYDLDYARQFLAALIMPLVQDKFVPKSEYEKQQFLERMKQLQDTLIESFTAVICLPYLHYTFLQIIMKLTE
jgi:hypothetical protein